MLHILGLMTCALSVCNVALSVSSKTAEAKWLHIIGGQTPHEDCWDCVDKTLEFDECRHGIGDIVPQCEDWRCIHNYAAWWECSDTEGAESTDCVTEVEPQSVWRQQLRRLENHDCDNNGWEAIPGLPADGDCHFFSPNTPKGACFIDSCDDGTIVSNQIYTSKQVCVN